MGIFGKEQKSIIMAISTFYLTNNRLMYMLHTLLYLHDDIFLKNSKEFIH